MGGTARWKTEVIDNLFFPHEAELIKSIPLSVTLPVDRMVWAGTSNGNFTVRSAYKLAVNLFTSATCGTTSDGSSLRKFWRKIWSLPIPHKVRHFCWRACRDTLPTKVKLRRCNVIVEDMCVCCHEEAQTNGHIFGAVRKSGHGSLDNKLPSGVLVRSGFMPSCYIRSGLAPARRTTRAFAFSLASSFSRLKVALCRTIKAPLGSLEVEAKAYEAGLLLARHLGLRDVVLEGDSLLISNALKRFTQSPTSIDAIVEGIHELGAEIGAVNFSHVRKIDNKPAHILARQAQNLVNDVIWIEEIPCCIQQALIQDESVL
ncbi:hypothetical protein SO802_026170 [Lithocarpus litseifolius]|uniref:RNase H type-1 domain-containing protein n=1 Tax=Lithocarpus litseifolius TaxID=425828 RepID=A0AAW2C464_9ROSI